MIAAAAATSSDTWVVLLAVATLALALATVVLAFFTRKSARASEALVLESRDDRRLSMRPVIVSPRTSGQRVDKVLVPRVLIRNIGKGPAINVVLWACADGKYFAKSGITMAPGEMSPEPDTRSNPPDRAPHVLKAYTGNADCSRYARDEADQNGYAYCSDALGNCFRFNLRRSSDPPEVWLRGTDPPDWRGAWLEAGAAPPADLRDRSLGPREPNVLSRFARSVQHRVSGVWSGRR